MASKKRIDVSESAARTALKHNPFGALSGAGAPASPPESEVRAGQPSPKAASAGSAAQPELRVERKLVVRRESKGRGGKTVTRVTGLNAQQREHVTPTLKKKLGCGAVIEGEDLLLLGDVVDRAAQWFEEQGVTRIVKGN